MEILHHDCLVFMFSLTRSLSLSLSLPICALSPTGAILPALFSSSLACSLAREHPHMSERVDNVMNNESRSCNDDTCLCLFIFRQQWIRPMEQVCSRTSRPSPKLNRQIRVPRSATSLDRCCRSTTISCSSSGAFSIFSHSPSSFSAR